MQWQTALLCGVLVVTTGCAGVVEFGDEPTTPALTPVPVPTDAAQPERYPAGVSEDGVSNVSALLAAHERALGTQSFTLYRRASTTTDLDEGASILRHNVTVSVGQSGTLRERRVQTRQFPAGRVARGEETVYETRDVRYVRRGTETVVSRTGDGLLGRDRVLFETTFAMRQYLPTDDGRTVRIERDGAPFYVVVGDGGKPRWASLLEETREYRLTVLIDENGLVHQFHVRYRSTQQTVRFDLWYRGVGTTTVERPAWAGADPSTTR